MAATTTLAIDMNQGGVGKTTTSFHVAMFLYGAGKRVLGIGMDTNQGFTKILMKKRFNAHAVGRSNNQDLLEHPGMDWHSAVIHYDTDRSKLALIQRAMGPSAHPGGQLDIITESRELADAYENFEPTGQVGKIGGSFPFVLDRIVASGEYDWVVVDNSPDWNPMSKSVLYACSWVIAPVVPAPLSLDSLEEYVERVDTANRVRREANQSRKTQFLGVLVSRVKQDLAMQQAIATQLPESLRRSNLTPFYHDPSRRSMLMIHETDAVLASSANGLPSWANDPEDVGSQAFLDLGRGILHQVG